MTIEILEGQSDRLYSLVAPLVMDRNVLRQNNHYPFWTSPAHTWFVALNNRNEVMAFFPLEVNAKGEAKINNYYMTKARKAVFEALIQEIVAFCRRRYTLSAVVLMQHKALFEAVGFQSTKEWRLYVKMEYSSKAAKETASKSAGKIAKETAPKTAKKADKTTKTAKKSVATAPKTAKTAVQKVAKTSAKKTAKKRR